MIIEVAPGIKFVRAQGAGFPYCHCLVIDSEIRAIIDTGAGARALAPIEPKRIDIVINTHYHRDHTEGNHLFPNARVLVHRLEYPPLVDEEARRYYSGISRLHQMKVKIQRKAKNEKSIPPGIPRRWVHQRWRDHRFWTYPGQGSTYSWSYPGHIAFHFEREDIVFGSDIDLIPFGPWYGDYLSNLDDFEASIRRIIELKPRIYCCSHRKPMRENIEERLLTYLGKIKETESLIEKHLTKPVSLDDLVGRNIIYKEI